MAIHADAHGHGSAHHWEWSWAPAAIALAAFCFTLAFTLFFVYQLQLPAIVAAGLLVPLALAGIAEWMSEMGQPTVPALNSLGLALFIFGEILIFLGIFAAYWFLRINTAFESDVWPPAGTPEIGKVLPLIMTAILVTSSLTYHKAEKALRKGTAASPSGCRVDRPRHRFRKLHRLRVYPSVERRLQAGHEPVFDAVLHTDRLPRDARYRRLAAFLAVLSARCSDRCTRRSSSWSACTGTSSTSSGSSSSPSSTSGRAKRRSQTWASCHLLAAVVGAVLAGWVSAGTRTGP